MTLPACTLTRPVPGTRRVTGTRLLLVQFTWTPGLYPGPGLYTGPGYYPRFYGMSGPKLIYDNRPLTSRGFCLRDVCVCCWRHYDVITILWDILALAKRLEQHSATRYWYVRRPHSWPSQITCVCWKQTFWTEVVNSFAYRQINERLTHGRHLM